MSNKLETFFKSYADSDTQLDFKMAHETVGEKVPVIKTGTYVLYDVLSSCGLPKGRLIQYYGAPASGKTLLAMLAIKEAQKEEGTNQLFIDAEETFDPNWAESLGLDTSRIMIIQGEQAINGRRCFEMLLGIPKADAKHVLNGKSKEGFLDKVAQKEFNFNLIVLDSLGALIPPGEDTSAIGKSNMALLARFLTPTFRKLSLEVSKAGIPFIIINHKRDNMDLYGPDHTFSGGNSYAHFLSVNIYFEAVARKDSIILNENEEKIGHTIRATVEKNKLGPHPRKCEFKVEFSKGIIDQHEEIAELAIKYNVVSKPSNVSYEYKNNKWVGNGKYCEAIKNDPNLAQELLQEIEKTRENKLDSQRLEQLAKKEKLSILVDEEKSKKNKKSKNEEE